MEFISPAASCIIAFALSKIELHYIAIGAFTGRAARGQYS